MKKPTILLGSTPVAAVVAEYKRLSDLAPDPIGWRVVVSEGEPMTDDQMEVHMTITPEDRLKTIDAYLEEMRNERSTHLEELARAMIREMGLTTETISQLAIVEERHVNKTVWYFQKRDQP